MPIPRVRDNEDESQFVSRCMEATAEDSGTREQKLAICFRAYRERNESASTARAELGAVLREAFRGR